MSISKAIPPEPVALLRIPVVLRLRGDRSQSAHYQDIKDGLFPRPVQIGARAVGHPANEVAAVTAARIAGKNDAEIRELVRQLEAARKAAA
jgi:prophage regulatory protein